METLYDYLMESESKYDQFTDDIDELLSLCPKLFLSSLRLNFPDIVDHVKDIMNQLDDDMIYIYAPGSSIFKIQRGYNDSLVQILENKYKNIFTYKLSDGVVKVYYKAPGEKNIRTVFQTGNGSIGRVSTDQQESATCMVWNAFVSGQLDLDRHDRDNIVKNFVSSISEDFDKDWIRSFSKHVLVICEYLTNYIGVDPMKYKLCLSHKSNLNTEPNNIGKEYEGFVKAYTKAVGGKAKDPYDPSDVVAYLNSETSSIKSLLNQYKSNPIEGKIRYKEELFDKNKVIGFSLKKITGKHKAARFDVYNDGKSADKCSGIKQFEVSKRTSDVQVVVNCQGDFNFDYTTDETGEILGSEKTVDIILRSFGSSVAMDCTIKGDGPTLGKCPVSVWRPIIGTDVKDSLEVCVKKFKKYLESMGKTKILIDLKKIILASIKQGEHCFPFVLIH